MVARFVCESCKAPLSKRGARCRVCGWAADYDPKTSRREREMVLGVSLVMVGIVLAIALAIAIAYVKPML
jgi:predicted amidophosphoribosyltransferase